jgi:hypothetical protein
VRPVLHALETTPGTSDTALVAAAVQCVHKVAHLQFIVVQLKIVCSSQLKISS